MQPSQGARAVEAYTANHLASRQVHRLGTHFLASKPDQGAFNNLFRGLLMNDRRESKQFMGIPLFQLGHLVRADRSDDGRPLLPH